MKVFVVKFDWSTPDAEDVELFIYRHYDDAYDKFKEIIMGERNPEMSWVGDIEFDDDGYPIDDHYEFEFEDNNSGESEVYWHIVDKDNYYQHSFIDLLTGYCESEDFCFIMDCYGMFEKLWQFSSMLLQKGLKVLEVGNDSKFMDGNIGRIDENAEKVFLRANADGKPEYITQTINGITYKAVKVADKIYIPDRSQTV